MANRTESGPAARRGTSRKRQTPVKRARTKAPVNGAAPEAAATQQIEIAAEAATAAQVAPEERYQLIAEAAYLIAEKRGFGEGRELEDWLEAEAIVAARLQDKPA